jgi:hypothetical protein
MAIFSGRDASRKRTNDLATATRRLSLRSRAPFRSA